MKINNVVFALLAASPLVFAGCHSGAYQPINTTKYDLENQASFVDMDAGAQRSVTCSGIQVQPLADGRLQITTNVRNREERRIEVQIKCEFKDAQGFTTGDETPWDTLILTENEQKGVKFISMNNLAQRYTIKVRQAR
jgi:uncharacterized protein YcfL